MTLALPALKLQPSNVFILNLELMEQEQEKSRAEEGEEGADTADDANAERPSDAPRRRGRVNNSADSFRAISKLEVNAMMS